MAPEDDALYAVTATQVLETAELIEMILLNLGQKEIVKVQAVTKTIKNTIAGSHKLQRKMYRRQRVPWEKVDNSISDINPVLFPSVDTLSFHLHANPGSAFAMHHRPSRTTRTGEVTSNTFTLTIADEDYWVPALPSLLPKGY